MTPGCLARSLERRTRSGAAAEALTVGRHGRGTRRWRASSGRRRASLHVRSTLHLGCRRPGMRRSRTSASEKGGRVVCASSVSLVRWRASPSLPRASRGMSGPSPWRPRCSMLRVETVGSPSKPSDHGYVGRRLHEASRFTGCASSRESGVTAPAIARKSTASWKAVQSPTRGWARPHRKCSINPRERTHGLMEGHAFTHARPRAASSRWCIDPRDPMKHLMEGHASITARPCEDSWKAPDAPMGGAARPFAWAVVCPARGHGMPRGSNGLASCGSRGDMRLRSASALSSRQRAFR
jgi:hypothetical protein